MTTYFKQDEIKQHAIDYLKENRDYCTEYGCDLHHQIFNMDYYIIGTYQAKEWMGEKAFDCIGDIQEYEKDNFGEVNTDLGDPERVVNMYAYIVGEAVLNESQTLQDNWDNRLDPELIDQIIEELEE